MPLSFPSLDTESSIENLRRQLTKPMTINRDQEVHSTDITPGDTSYDPSLLTPPRSKHSLGPYPFKAKDDDQISLSMKGRHTHNSRRRRHDRECVSSDDVDNRYFDHSIVARPPSQARSLPDLKHTLKFASTLCQIEAKQETPVGSRHVSANIQREELPRRPRRWTMPSKSSPAKAHTDTSPPRRFTTSTRTQRPSARTPAMISLRRATTSKPARLSTQPNVYTSFPRPSFTQTRSSFFTKIWGIDGDDSRRNTLVSTPALAAHRASVISQSNVRLGSIDQARPVCTEVNAAQFSPQRSRRCSSRHVGDNGVYEVIWDENTSVSISSSSSSGVSRSVTQKGRGSTPSSDPRRHSVAMDKLETQLFKAIQDSRRSSVAPWDKNDALQHQQAFRDLLDFKFSQFHNINALSQLPRSKASKTTKLTTDTAPLSRISEPISEPNIDYSIILHPRAKTRSTPRSDAGRPLVKVLTGISVREGKQPSVVDNTVPETSCPSPGPRLGSSIGQSTHVRRNPMDPWKRKRSITASMVERLAVWERRPSCAMGRGLSVPDVEEEEKVPLLGGIKNVQGFEGWSD